MILYKAPKFKEEFENLIEVPELALLGLQDWYKVASKGKAVRYNDIFRILSSGYTPKTAAKGFSMLSPEKQANFEKILATEIIEMPIIYSRNMSDHTVIGGRTRLMGLIKQGIDPYVWQISK